MPFFRVLAIQVLLINQEILFTLIDKLNVFYSMYDNLMDWFIFSVINVVGC